MLLLIFTLFHLLHFSLDFSGATTRDKTHRMGLFVTGSSWYGLESGGLYVPKTINDFIKQESMFGDVYQITRRDEQDLIPPNVNFISVCFSSRIIHLTKPAYT